MEKNKKDKIAYGLWKCLYQFGDGSALVSDIIERFSTKYSMDIKINELDEVINFINDEYYDEEFLIIYYEPSKDTNGNFTNWEQRLEWEVKTDVMHFEIPDIISEFEKKINDNVFTDIDLYFDWDKLESVDEELNNLNKTNNCLLLSIPYFEIDNFISKQKISDFKKSDEIKICFGIVKKLIEYNKPTTNHGDEYVGSFIYTWDVMQFIKEEYLIYLNYAEFRNIFFCLTNEFKLDIQEYIVDLKGTNINDKLDNQQDLGYWVTVEKDTLVSILKELEIKLTKDYNEQEEKKRGLESLYNPLTDETDIFKTKKDAWGNLYTEGGQMWEDYNNKRREYDNDTDL